MKILLLFFGLITAQVVTEPVTTGAGVATDGTEIMETGTAGTEIMGTADTDIMVTGTEGVTDIMETTALDATVMDTTFMDISTISENSTMLDNSTNDGNWTTTKSLKLSKIVTKLVLFCVQLLFH